MGYINYSRSERSQDAIDNYEMPLSMFNKYIIEEFLEDIGVDIYSKEEIEMLGKVSLAKWKYIADRIGPSSWHHTGKMYKKTDHYSLESVADEIVSEGIEEIDRLYKIHLEFKKEAKLKKDKERDKIIVGYVIKQVWGGTRNRPRYLGTERIEGVIIGDWLHYYEYGHKKCNLYSNSIEKYEVFGEYKNVIRRKGNTLDKDYYKKIIDKKIKNK